MWEQLVKHPVWFVLPLVIVLATLYSLQDVVGSPWLQRSVNVFMLMLSGILILVPAIMLVTAGRLKSGPEFAFALGLFLFIATALTASWLQLLAAPLLIISIVLMLFGLFGKKRKPALK